MEKLKGGDVLDIILRGLMPEIGDLMERTANELPPWLKKRLTARGCHIIGQLVERVWRGNRVGEAVSDLIERLGAAVDDAAKGKFKKDELEAGKVLEKVLELFKDTAFQEKYQLMIQSIKNHSEREELMRILAHLDFDEFVKVVYAAEEATFILQVEKLRKEKLDQLMKEKDRKKQERKEEMIRLGGRIMNETGKAVQKSIQILKELDKKNDTFFAKLNTNSSKWRLI